MHDVPCRSCQLTSPTSRWMRSGWVHPHSTHQPPNLTIPIWPSASFLAWATAASPFIQPLPAPNSPALIPVLLLLPEESFCISYQLAFVAEETSSELSGLMQQACAARLVGVCRVGWLPGPEWSGGWQSVACGCPHPPPWGRPRGWQRIPRGEESKPQCASVQKHDFFFKECHHFIWGIIEVHQAACI